MKVAIQTSYVGSRRIDVFDDVRLTKTQIVVKMTKQHAPRYRLSDGNRVGGSSGYRREKVLFDHEETSDEIRKAHEAAKAAKAKTTADRDEARRERHAEQSRSRAFKVQRLNLTKAVVAAAEKLVDLDFVETAPVAGENARIDATEELRVAVYALRVLRSRGAVPPDCGHRRCRSYLTCKVEE